MHDSWGFLKQAETVCTASKKKKKGGGLLLMFLPFTILSLNVHFHEFPAGSDLCADAWEQGGRAVISSNRLARAANPAGVMRPETVLFPGADKHKGVHLQRWPALIM